MLCMWMGDLDLNSVSYMCVVWCGCVRRGVWCTLWGKCVGDCSTVYTIDSEESGCVFVCVNDCVSALKVETISVYKYYIISHISASILQSSNHHVEHWSAHGQHTCIVCLMYEYVPYFFNNSYIHMVSYNNRSESFMCWELRNRVWHCTCVCGVYSGVVQDVFGLKCDGFVCFIRDFFRLYTKEYN